MKKFILGTCLLAVSFSAMAINPIKTPLDAKSSCEAVRSSSLRKQAVESFQKSTKQNILNEIQRIYKENKLSPVKSITLVGTSWNSPLGTKINDIYSVEAGNDSIEIEVNISDRNFYSERNIGINAAFEKDAIGRIIEKTIVCSTSIRTGDQLKNVTISLKNHASDQVISEITVPSNFTASQNLLK